MRKSGTAQGDVRWLWLAVIAVVSLDQISKQWMLSLVFTPPRIIELTSFFNLVPVWNRGISFGLFASHSELVRVVTIALAGIVVIFLARQLSTFPPIVKLAAAGIMAGAAGNMIDRIIHGQVVDFIDLHLVGYHWPAFNIADAAISIGVFLWICAILSGNDTKRGDKAADNSAD